MNTEQTLAATAYIETMAAKWAAEYPEAADTLRQFTAVIVQDLRAGLHVEDGK